MDYQAKACLKRRTLQDGMSLNLAAGGESLSLAVSAVCLKRTKVEATSQLVRSLEFSGWLSLLFVVCCAFVLTGSGDIAAAGQDAAGQNVGQNVGQNADAGLALRTQESMVRTASDPSQRTRLSLELAKMLIKDQRRSSARQVLNDLRHSSGISTDSLVEVARMLGECGAGSDAVACLESLKSSTTDVRFRHRLSRQLVQKLIRSERTDAAVQELKLLVGEVQPGSAIHLELVDQLLALVDQVDGTTAVAQQCVELTTQHPDIPTLHSRAASLLLEKGDLKNALMHAEKAVQQNLESAGSAGSVEDQILLGRILWNLGRKDEAKTVWEQVPQDRQGDLVVIQQMIDVYRDAGESADEQRWLARGCELDCPVSLRLRYARILAAGQELEAAIEQFRICIEREESRAVRNEIRQELAALLDRSGIAEDELAKLLARTESENDPGTWLEIAALQLQKEQFSGVVDAAERAVSGAGAASGAGPLADDWLFVADALVARQQQASAVSVLRIWNRVSNSRSGLSRLAGLFFEQQEFAEAVQVHRALLETSSSRQDELQQIESLSVLARLLSQQELHLQYLDERHARSQTSPDRTVSGTVSRTVDRATSFLNMELQGRAADELQLFVQSAEFLNLEEVPAVTVRSELARLVTLAEQLEQFSIAIRLQEALERGQIGSNRTGIPRSAASGKLPRSLLLRAQYATREDLVTYVKSLQPSSDSSWLCCRLIDELVRVGRVSVAVQLLPDLATQAFDDWAMSLRIAALYQLAGDESEASAIVGRLFSEYSSRTEYSGYELEVTPGDLQAAHFARGFADWFTGVSLTDWHQFPGFPQSMRELEVSVLAIWLRQAQGTNERDRMIAPLIASAPRKDSSQELHAEIRRVEDWYLLRRGRMSRERESAAHEISLSLELLLNKSVVSLLQSQSPQFLALLTSDWLHVIGRDPNADFSSLIPAIRSLVDSGVLLDETLWLPSREGVQWLADASRLIGSPIPNVLKHRLTGLSDSASGDSTSEESPTAGSKTSWGQQSSLMAMALEQERQGNSSAACDLYLRVLHEHRAEFVMEFETLLQGFESSRREGDLAAALMDGDLRDFSDVADALLFLSVRVCRQAKDRMIGRTLFERMLEVFPRNRLRYLVTGHQSGVLTDAEFLSAMSKELQDGVSQGAEAGSLLGGLFPGFDQRMLLNPSAMEDIWMHDELTEAVRLVNRQQSELLVPMLRELVETHTDWSDGRVLLRLLELAASETPSADGRLTGFQNWPTSTQEVASAGHLDVLMQQRGAAAEFLQMRKQILSSMLESSASSTAMKKWAALRLIEVLLQLDEPDTCLQILRAQRDQRLAEITARSGSERPAATPGERQALELLVEGFRRAKSDEESESLNSKLQEMN